MSLHGLIAHFFLALNNSPLSGWALVLLIYSLITGHLGCFHILAIMTKTAVIIRVLASVWT